MSPMSPRLGLLTCGMIALGPVGAWATSFSYTTLLPPNADQANLAGIYGDTALVDATANTSGAWKWSGGTFTALPQAVGDVLRVSDNGLAVGQPSAFTYAIYDLTTRNTTIYNLPFSGTTSVELTGINASGQ